MDFFHYNKNLKSFARQLRKDPTRAEIRMWQNVLRNKQMMGYRFLRQRAIDKYIVDFFCKELKLIIEIDGITHQWEEVAKKDVIREDRLRELGYQMLRFTDDEVKDDLPNVIRTLENWILDFEEQYGRPIPPVE
ncbi:endonuclease domain-containing protein [Cytophagales bacterium LB-30]|uniref:Endonuclease domain-containing protein n=1 Tax=Shiella aurantiaca TaxID=3058365 RepID=A0ABT8F2Z6_9BACT|nr:endonuclease domain-containing protein [Shiella aurantiaca]MDN4164753.1 endonuclease domain-containing protein [Shiella aurantiaca]